MTETVTAAHPLPLEAIHLPPAPTFWPFAWGWWSLAATVILVILALFMFIRWRKNKVKAKKAALALLSMERHRITPSGAMEIVRQAVLSYYPRERVACLSGVSWLTFLDSQIKQPLFLTREQDWLTALYQKPAISNQDELISQCQIWLDQALPPRRGGRG